MSIIEDIDIKWKILIFFAQLVIMALFIFEVYLLKKLINIIDTKIIMCHIVSWNEKYAIAAHFEK